MKFLYDDLYLKFGDEIKKVLKIKNIASFMETGIEILKKLWKTATLILNFIILSFQNIHCLKM